MTLLEEAIANKKKLDHVKATIDHYIKYHNEQRKGHLLNAERASSLHSRGIAMLHASRSEELAHFFQHLKEEIEK